MTPSAKFCRIPLDSQPFVLQMGIGTHGHRNVERYKIANMWCLHMYDYDAELYVNDVLFPIRPGSASLVPPNTRVEYRFSGPSKHIYTHFSLLQSPTRESTLVPIMQDLGSEFSVVSHAMQQAISYLPTQPRRAEVRLWDILWQLVSRPNNSMLEAQPEHPAVQRALGIIEVRLGDRLRVPELAREVGLSHNHLTRLFRTALGTTVLEYIQRRRAQQAKHLLVYSTLSIKAIAASVGVNDLQQFNKLTRRFLGHSPRHIRNSTTHSFAIQQDQV